MDSQTFLAEAARLSRSCTVYKQDGMGTPSAFWHGVEPGLCLSILHDKQWLNVVLGDDSSGGTVETGSQASESDIRLYAQPETSLPPVDAIFFRGTDAVDDYLRHYEWPRDEPFNDNFPDSIPVEYDRYWRTKCPLYRPGISLVSGGWHIPWPDGDWYEFADAELIACTFLDSEPWVEIFKANGRYVVKQRVT